MLDKQLLVSIIEESGYKHKFLASKLGMTRETFSRRLAGVRDFKATEIATLCRILKINKADRDKIFFS